MIGTGWRVAVVLALALAGAARADDPRPWDGVWDLEGSAWKRIVTTSASGQVVLSLEVERQPVTCVGVDGPTLRLEGHTTQTIGLTGVLAQREGETEKVPVQVTVERLPADPTGAERARARVTARGRVVAEERWTRPGLATLDVVSTSASELDPLAGPLDVRVLVAGRAQRVALTVELPERERSARTEFYRQRAVLRGSILCTIDAGVLAPGAHTLHWDGRDRTSDRRVALHGPYVLRVDSPERRADGADTPRPVHVAVVLPRATVHAPIYTDGRTNQVSFMSSSLPPALGAGFRVTHSTARLTAQDFLAAIRGDAAVFVGTHGAPATFLTGNNTAPDEMSPAQVRRFAMAASDPKPLKDVHAVFITSCLSAVPQERYEQGRRVIDSLPGTLLDSGVDVVVASTGLLWAEENETYHEVLGPRLLRRGMTIERAVRDAGHSSFQSFWLRYVPARKRALWFWDSAEYEEFCADLLASSSVRDAMRVMAAPGIDPNTETLVPARHGCSTN